MYFLIIHATYIQVYACSSQKSDISVHPHTTPSQCGMCNHDNIQHSENQMESKQIPSPEDVVSIQLDIDNNISLDDNNFATNSEEHNIFTLDNYSSDYDEINNYYIEYETTQIQNYSRDTIIQEDVNNGWEKVDEDDKTDSHNPEDIFNNLFDFDNRMFTIIADATNEYAQGKITSILRNRGNFEQIEHHSQRRHAKLSSWRDMNASDIILHQDTCSSQLMVNKKSM